MEKVALVFRRQGEGGQRERERERRSGLRGVEEGVEEGVNGFLHSRVEEYVVLICVFGFTAIRFLRFFGT